MSILLIITISLLITFIGSRIASHFNYPPTLGQFMASFLLAIPFIQESVFTEESLKVINALSELAIVFLLFLGGLKTNLNRIQSCKKETFSIALLGILIPFLLSTLAGPWLGLSLLASFIMGFMISITAEGANLAILIQLKKLKSKLGSIIVGAGILNDIFAILFLTIVLVLTHENGLFELAITPVKLAGFTLATYIVYKLLPSFLGHFEKQKKEVAIFNIIILTALIFAILSEILGFSATLGAFIAGVILQQSFIFKRDEKHEEHEIETLLFGFIIPFFFIKVALNFDATVLINDAPLVLSILGIALAGKIIGTLLAKPFTSLKMSQLHLIGWEMNSRGVLELIIAEIALTAGLIPERLYSAIVIVAILSLIISPFFVRAIVKRDPRIMNR